MLKLIVDDTDEWDRGYERLMALRITYEFYGRPEFMHEFRQEAPSTVHSLEEKARAATGKAKVDFLYQAHHCYQMMCVDAILRQDVRASSGYTLRLMDLTTRLDEAKTTLAKSGAVVAVERTRAYQKTL